MKDYYVILDLRKNATPGEIKTSYRKLALQFHPDRNASDPYFANKFAEIQEAYQTLSNNQKRSIYDKLREIYIDEQTLPINNYADDFQKPSFSWNILIAAIIVILFMFLTIHALE